MANSKSDNTNKVFDVAKPGKTAANASARPVIIGHKPLLQDPMVKDISARDLADKTKAKILISQEDKPADGKSSRGRLLSPSAVKIEPLKTTETIPAEPASAQEAAPTANQPSVPTTDQSSEDPKAEPTEEKSADQSNGTDASAAISNPVGQAEAQKIADKQQQETAAKQQSLEKLIAEKNYFVEIGKKKRRSMRRLMLLLVLVLIGAVLAVDLLIDAGVIKTNIKPPINLINN